jgi:hypothetical protein
MSGVIALANVIPDMRALSSLDVSINGIGNYDILPDGWIYDPRPNKYSYKNASLKKYQDEPPPGSKSSGVIAFAGAIKDMGALSVLSLKDNKLATKEGGKALAQALVNNSTLKELDVSSNNWKDDYGDWQGNGPGFAQELAAGIKDNGAISSVNVLMNNIGIEQAQALASILKAHPTLRSLCGNKGDETELDMSGKKMRSYERHDHACSRDAIMLAPEIIDNGALSVTNVMGNCIGKEQLAELQEIMRSKPNLVSLCGIADDATEADLSSLGMDADDAAILASELPDKGAMTSLNLASNYLCGLDENGEGVYDASGTVCFLSCLTCLSSYLLDCQCQGIIALANAIPDMRAMTSLNLASNSLSAEGAKIVAAAIKVTKCARTCNHFGTIFMSI